MSRGTPVEKHWSKRNVQSEAKLGQILDTLFNIYPVTKGDKKAAFDNAEERYL